MAILNGYATLAEIKARLDITVTTMDTILENVVEAASRQIDGWTSRRFYRVSETRYYTAVRDDYLSTDEYGTINALMTDHDGDGTYEVNWAGTDFHQAPYNAPVDGAPYTEIRVTPQGVRTFPRIPKGVSVNATFGYSTTYPDAVNEACLLIATRLAKRPTAPFGIEAAPELGIFQQISRFDPDVIQLLAAYRNMSV